MRTSFQIAISIYAALIAAVPFRCPLTATVTVTVWVEDHVPSSSAISVTSAPFTCSTSAPDVSGNYMMLVMIDSYGTQWPLLFGSNVGAPSPVGNPSMTTLPDTSPTQYTSDIDVSLARSNFIACTKATYTYPKDNEANLSNLRSDLVPCCIDMSCKAPSRQLHEQEYSLHEKSIQNEVIEPKENRENAGSSVLTFAHKHRRHHH